MCTKPFCSNALFILATLGFIATTLTGCEKVDSTAAKLESDMTTSAEKFASSVATKVGSVIAEVKPANPNSFESLYGKHISADQKQFFMELRQLANEGKTIGYDEPRKSEKFEEKYNLALRKLPKKIDGWACKIGYKIDSLRRQCDFGLNRADALPRVEVYLFLEEGEEVLKMKLYDGDIVRISGILHHPYYEDSSLGRDVVDIPGNFSFDTDKEFDRAMDIPLVSSYHQVSVSSMEVVQESK